MSTDLSAPPSRIPLPVRDVVSTFGLIYLVYLVGGLLNFLWLPVLTRFGGVSTRLAETAASLPTILLSVCACAIVLHLLVSRYRIAIALLIPITMSSFSALAISRLAPTSDPLLTHELRLGRILLTACFLVVPLSTLLVVYVRGVRSTTGAGA